MDVQQSGPATGPPKLPIDTSNSRVTIIVAAIGVVGVLGTAVLSNWDKLTSSPRADDRSKATGSNATAINPNISPTISPNISPTISPNISPTITIAPPAPTKALSLEPCLPGLMIVPPQMREQYAQQAIRDSESLATALATSAMNGNLACVEGLLEAGAPPNGPGRAMGGQTREVTPLIGAIQANSVEIMKLLIRRGADPNLRAMAKPGSPGLSPIAAASSSSIDAVQLLLSKGVDVNSPVNDGLSALHRAVSKGDIQIVQELLKYGAKVDAKTSDGKTPLDFAKDKHAVLIPILMAK